MTLADIWHGHRFCQQDTLDQRSRRSTRHNKDVLEMDHRGLETAPDHKLSPASWETYSELESEQSRIDEDHSFDDSLDHGLDQLSSNGT